MLRAFQRHKSASRRCSMDQSTYDLILDAFGLLICASLAGVFFTPEARDFFIDLRKYFESRGRDEG